MAIATVKFDTLSNTVYSGAPVALNIYSSMTQDYKKATSPCRAAEAVSFSRFIIHRRSVCADDRTGLQHRANYRRHLR